MGNYRDCRLWVEKRNICGNIYNKTSHKSLKKRKPIHSHMIITWFIWTNRSLADVLWLYITHEQTNTHMKQSIVFLHLALPVDSVTQVCCI